MFGWGKGRVKEKQEKEKEKKQSKVAKGDNLALGQRNQEHLRRTWEILKGRAGHKDGAFSLSHNHIHSFDHLQFSEQISLL